MALKPIFVSNNRPAFYNLLIGKNLLPAQFDVGMEDNQLLAPCLRTWRDKHQPGILSIQ